MSLHEDDDALPMGTVPSEVPVSKYSCPECFRPEGEMHKVECKYDFDGFVHESDLEDFRAEDHAQGFLREDTVPAGRSERDLADSVHRAFVSSHELDWWEKMWVTALLAFGVGVAVGMVLVMVMDGAAA